MWTLTLNECVMWSLNNMTRFKSFCNNNIVPWKYWTSASVILWSSIILCSQATSIILLPWAWLHNAYVLTSQYHDTGKSHCLMAVLSHNRISVLPARALTGNRLRSSAQTSLCQVIHFTSSLGIPGISKPAVRYDLFSGSQGCSRVTVHGDALHTYLPGDDQGALLWSAQTTLTCWKILFIMYM